MAYWWGPYPCTIDLLTASEYTIRNAVRCRWPGFSVAERESEVTDLLALQRSLLTSDAILNRVSGAMAGIEAGAYASVQANLASLTSGASSQVNSALGTMNARLGDTFAKASQSNQSVIDKVLTSIGGLANNAGGVVTGVLNSLTGGVGTTVLRLGGTIDGVVGDIMRAITGAINTSDKVVGDILGTVATGVAGAMTGGTAVLRGIGDLVGVSVNGLIESAGEVVSFLTDKLSGLPAALSALGAEIVDGLTRSFAPGIALFGDTITDPETGIFGRLFHVEEADLLAAIGPALQRAANAPDMPPEWRRVFSYVASGSAPVPAIIGAILAVPLMMSALQAVGGPFLELAHRESMAIARPTPLTLGDAINAYFRDRYSTGQVNRVAGFLGYSESDVGVAIETARPLPAVVEVIEWLHRELLTEGGAAELLSQMGFAPAQVANFIAAAPVIPPLSDLVHFAVREAFPGQVAYGGAAGAGVPGGFVDAAKKLGVDETFARSYWAAHWELPSVQQGFEMYHRSVIDRGQLEQLLVVGDVMPEWRAPLVAIANNPLTRVDIRRMHELGVIDTAGVHRAHLDIGYSDAHAALLTRFVVELNTDVERVAAAPDKDLSRGDIIGAYADGILTRTEAGSYLAAIAYSADESELILLREDMRAERARRSDSRSTIEQAAIVGVLDDEQAQDALSLGGFTATEQALALDRITAGRAARIEAPTRADLFRFRKVGIIDDAELKAGLFSIGYREPWLGRFVELAKTAQAPV